MTQRTGTFDISSLLAARFQSVADFGVDTIADVLAADIAAHNMLVEDMMRELAAVTTDRQRKAGSSISGEMTEVDEFGRAPTQKDLPGATVGFPLRLYQFNLGWTATYLKAATPADLAIRTQQSEKAHLRGVVKQLKRALFLSSDYTFRDHLVDNVDLSVKRLANADGQPIPDGPNGEVFDGDTHTHYDAVDGLTAAKLTALVNDVVEHGHGGAVRIAINTADEATVRALTGFVAYVDPRLTLRSDENEPDNRRADITRMDNRPIGIFGAAEVWVKPWAIANYAFCYDSSAEGKPLAFRQRSQEALQGLRIAAEFENHPLHAQYMEAEFGIGVWTRTNGAVLYFAGGTYTDPSL